MDLDEVIEELGLSKAAEVLRREWEVSQQSLPEGELPFLSPEFVRRACREADLPDEVRELAAAAGPRVAANPAARALAWHFHYCVFRAESYPRGRLEEWPAPGEALGDDADVFYLLPILSGLPTMQRLHQARSVPADIARDTVSDLKLWLEEEKKAHPDGRWRFTASNAWWLSHHLRGELYQVGRLQFQMGRFAEQVRVFRHAGSRQVVALSKDGVEYRADGGRATAEQSEEDGVWTSRLAEGEGEVIGHPILPTGSALPGEVRLGSGEWEQVATGQPALWVHIPAIGPLAHDLCGESFRAALGFFARHFPEWRFGAFCCYSWLLDTELEGFLRADSNIVRFQREFYLFPVAMAADSLLGHVFDEAPEDMARAPRGTSLQRAVADHVMAGRSLRASGGGGFLLREDVNWGAQVYRSQGLPW